MTTLNDKERWLRSTVLAGFTAGLLAVPAMAQDAEPAAEEEEEDKIVVTGSLLKRDEFTNAAPVQVITAETATLEGLLDTSEMLQSASVASGSNQINSQRTGFITAGGTGVNSVSLRGLGAQRTLVLINGRRPGPAGTRGQVGAFDLNVLPSAIVQRVEILKDGASSTYGSDAVAGVVNAITREQMTGGEINIGATVPFKSGGDSYSIDAAWGQQFGQTSFTVSAFYEKLEDLDISDRDYLSCNMDYKFDAAGNRIDDLEMQPGNPNFGNPKCFGALNEAYDTFSGAGLIRFIPDPNLTIGGVPGWRPRGATGVSPSYLENPTSNPKENSTDAINATERAGAFATATVELNNGIEFYAEGLYNHRETHSDDWRQFFPWVNGFTNPFVPEGFASGGTNFFARPIALIPFNQDVTINYYNVVGGLRGDVPNTKSWSWDAYVNFSNSDGDYVTQTVPANNVEDTFDTRTDVNTFFDAGTGTVVCQRISDGSSCPVINYFSPNFLRGDLTDEEKAFLFADDEGSTNYQQFVFRAHASGEVFDLPAGPALMAVGVEYRDFSIDDTPGQYSIAGNQWGLTSALRTAGSDNAMEAFGELEVPVVQDVTLNGSVRWADYDSSGDSTVYKIGGNWAVTDVLRLRSTWGTSYRAPALYELFLGNQTSFLGQGSVDPCIDWGSNTNANIRTNCAADGIPSNYAGVGPSALISTGGGLGVLEAETSEALNIGAIITPPDLNLSLAFDYFEIQVNDEVSRLGASSILGRCYGGDVYPNVFCNLFTRDTDPNSPGFLNILTVNDSFVNIDTQKTRGLDLTARYVRDTKWGEFTANLQGTWTFEDTIITFDGAVLDFETTDFNGTIGDPSFTAQMQLNLERENFTYSWFSDYVGPASNFKLDSTPNVGTKYRAEETYYHGASVRYRGKDWQIVAGMRNIFDEQPPALSFDAGSSRRGIVPIFSSQYDIRGRSGFIRLQKTFGG